MPILPTGGFLIEKRKRVYNFLDFLKVFRIPLIYANNEPNGISILKGDLYLRRSPIKGTHVSGTR